jgi:F-type H+-transporting ATPase subunit delta
MRYVRALFDYALGNKAEDAVFTDMKKLLQSFSANPKFKTALDNPILNTKNKLDLIKAAAGGNPDKAFARFIELVLRQKRENHLQTIAMLYLDMYRSYKKITVGRLVTAVPVDNATVEKIKQLVRKDVNGTIEFVTEVDSSIAGGFILYIGSYRLDASVSSQLKRIKDELLGKNKKVA